MGSASRETGANRTVPTGIALRDPRQQLFDAAEQLLLRAGPAALTSRAVTDEAGVAKGVLHKHFADFDDFLTQLVLDRIARLSAQSAALSAAVGTGTVAGNLAGALTDLFSSVAVGIVALVISRDGLRARLRAARPGARGVPLATEAAAMVAAYLTAERDLGRVAADADIAIIAPTLIGAAHLHFAGHAAASGPAPGPDPVQAMVITVLAGVLR
jgi:AcrR family transcriptional regulator